MAPKNTQQSKETQLKPGVSPLEIKGTVLYNESAKAWSLIRLKKELIQEFPELRNRREKFVYKMTILRSPKLIEEHLNKVKTEGGIIPIFLSFSKVTKIT